MACAGFAQITDLKEGKNPFVPKNHRKVRTPVLPAPEQPVFQSLSTFARNNWMELSKDAAQPNGCRYLESIFVGLNAASVDQAIERRTSVVLRNGVDLGPIEVQADDLQPLLPGVRPKQMFLGAKVCIAIVCIAVALHGNASNHLVLTCRLSTHSALF